METADEHTGNSPRNRTNEFEMLELYIDEIAAMAEMAIHLIEGLES